MNIYINQLYKSSTKCFLPKSVCHTLGLRPNVPYTLHNGSLNVPIYVEIDPENNETMSIPPSIIDKLLCQKNTQVNIWSKNKDIFLGPVVSIFVNSRYISKLIRGKKLINAQKYQQANRSARCLLYFFSPKDVNWTHNKIKGCYYSSLQKRWKQKWMPFPDIMYDRCVGYKKNKSDSQKVKQIRNKFTHIPGLTLINNGSLSKWKMYQCLSKYKDLKSHLPKTKYYHSILDFLNILNKYHYVFLKSSKGSAGRGVLSVEKKNNYYHAVYYKKSMQIRTFENINTLISFVKNFKKNNKMIIQTGIRLLKYNGRLLDLRILIGKDKHGKWNPIYNQVRLAKKNSTITSYSTGGDLINYTDIYHNLNKAYKNKIPSNEKINTFATKLAKAIEQELGQFGEIGLDLAIDTQGKLWFLEGNSKPTKNPVPVLEDTKGVPPQFLNILEYAKFLDGVDRHTGR